MVNPKNKKRMPHATMGKDRNYWKPFHEDPGVGHPFDAVFLKDTSRAVTWWKLRRSIYLSSSMPFAITGRFPERN